MQPQPVMPRSHKTNDQAQNNWVTDPHSAQVKSRLYLKILTACRAPIRHFK